MSGIMRTWAWNEDGPFARAIRAEVEAAEEALKAAYQRELELWLDQQRWEGLSVALSLEEIAARYPTARLPDSGPQEATQEDSEDVVPEVQGRILSYTNIEWPPGGRNASITRWSYDSEGTPTDD